MRNTEDIEAFANFFLASADETIDDDEFIPITRLKTQAQAKAQAETALPRPILKRFRIEDSDNDNEKETGGDEISKIGNNNDYVGVGTPSTPIHHVA